MSWIGNQGQPKVDILMNDVRRLIDNMIPNGQYDAPHYVEYKVSDIPLVPFDEHLWTLKMNRALDLAQWDHEPTLLGMG